MKPEYLQLAKEGSRNHIILAAMDKQLKQSAINVGRATANFRSFIGGIEPTSELARRMAKITGKINGLYAAAEALMAEADSWVNSNYDSSSRHQSMVGYSRDIDKYIAEGNAIVGLYLDETNETVRK